MGLFNKNTNTNPPAVKPVKTPATTFASARHNLLLVAAFTVVNIVLTLSQADIYFLFSATVPQFILALGYAFESSVALTVCAVLAFLGAGVYLLCWALSKKHRGWMVVALVLFVLDTLTLFLLYEPMSVLTDVIFHVLVLYYLITGTIAMVKMDKEPELAVEPAEMPAVAEMPTPVYQVPAAPAAPAEIPAETPAQVMVNGEPVEE